MGLLETSRERISRAIHYKLMSGDSFWRANAQEWCYPWQSRWWESPIIGQNWTEWKIGFLDVKECKLKRLRRFHRYRENWNSTRKISTTEYCSKKPIYRACMSCFIIIKKKKIFSPRIADSFGMLSANFFIYKFILLWQRNAITIDIRFQSQNERIF